jgi:predicted chitinase
VRRLVGSEMCIRDRADSGDMKTLTKRINGGDLGLADRIQHYQHALHVLQG